MQERSTRPPLSKKEKAMRVAAVSALATGIIGLAGTFVQEGMAHEQKNNEFNSALSDVGLSTEKYNNAQTRVLEIRKELSQKLINGSTSQEVQAILINQQNWESIDIASRGIKLRDRIYSKPDKRNSIRLLVRFASQMLAAGGLPLTVASFVLGGRGPKRTPNKLES